MSRPTEANSYCKGSATSYKKLSKFFGEDPPRLENIESLLAQLGYTDYLPVRVKIGKGLTSLNDCCVTGKIFCGHVSIDCPVPKWTGSGCRQFRSSYECFDLTKPVFSPATVC